MGLGFRVSGLLMLRGGHRRPDSKPKGEFPEVALMWAII